MTDAEIHSPSPMFFPLPSILLHFPSSRGHVFVFFTSCWSFFFDVFRGFFWTFSLALSSPSFPSFYLTFRTCTEEGQDSDSDRSPAGTGHVTHGTLRMATQLWDP